MGLLLVEEEGEGEGEDRIPCMAMHLHNNRLVEGLHQGHHHIKECQEEECHRREEVGDVVGLRYGISPCRIGPVNHMVLLGERGHKKYLSQEEEVRHGDRDQDMGKTLVMDMDKIMVMADHLDMADLLDMVDHLAMADPDLVLDPDLVTALLDRVEVEGVVLLLLKVG